MSAPPKSKTPCGTWPCCAVRPKCKCPRRSTARLYRSARDRGKRRRRRCNGSWPPRRPTWIRRRWRLARIWPGGSRRVLTNLKENSSTPKPINDGTRAGKHESASPNYGADLASQNCTYLGVLFAAPWNHRERALGNGAYREGVSKLAVARLEMGGFAQGFATTLHPVRSPMDHLLDANTRVAEQPMAQLAVAKQRIRRFRAAKRDAFAQQTAHLLGDTPHAEGLRPSDV